MVQVSELKETGIHYGYLIRFAYGPYQVFKKIGLPSPPTVPFFGNSLDMLKLVIMINIGAVNHLYALYRVIYGLLNYG